jgi:hypothetical protein
MTIRFEPEQFSGSIELFHKPQAYRKCSMLMKRKLLTLGVELFTGPLLRQG